MKIVLTGRMGSVNRARHVADTVWFACAIGRSVFPMAKVARKREFSRMNSTRIVPPVLEAVFRDALMARLNFVHDFFGNDRRPNRLFLRCWARLHERTLEIAVNESTWYGTTFENRRLLSATVSAQFTNVSKD